MGGKKKWLLTLVSVFLCTVCFPAYAAGRPHQVSEPGTYPSGIHYFPFRAEVYPSDALAMGTRPARRVSPGEQGRLIRVQTQVYRLRDGERSSQVTLEPSDTPGVARANLRAGTYEVVITTYRNSWQWNPHDFFRNPLTGRESYAALKKETTSFSYQTSSYIIEIAGDEEPHPCDGTDFRDGIQTPEAEVLRQAVADAFAAQGARIGPEHVVVNSPHRPASDPGWDMLSFTVPLQMTDNQPRHNMPCLMDAMLAGDIEVGTLIGAGELVYGVVHQIAGKTRVIINRAETETALVLDAGMSTVDGTGPDALNQAAQEAAADALSEVDFR